LSKGKRVKGKICPCGSGLREKKCCKGRKPRSKHVVFEMDKPTVVDGIQEGPDGQLQLLSKGKPVVAKNQYLDVSYKKYSGREKRLLSIPVSSAVDLTPEETIKDYDYIFAVDTNTKPSKGHSIKSVACALRGVVVKEADEYGLDLHYGSCFLSSEDHDKPENSAWHRTIQFMEECYPDEYMSKKFGLVVDSDLGSIKEYNNKEKPIVDDVFLPPNVSLIYASSDVGKEHIYNQMISIADKISNQMFKHLEGRGTHECFEPEA
jgi:hypothetical protein